MSNRAMTSGEQTLCAQVFGNSINMPKVRVHRGQYWAFFGMQDPNTAVTPNGEMYYPPQRYIDDFSAGDIYQQLLFIHELTHVWQYQLGYPVISRRMQFWRSPSYQYTLDPANTFCNYNMEAQANLLADYFALAVLGTSDIMNQPEYGNDLPLYEQVLHGFRTDPGNSANLPRADL